MWSIVELKPLTWNHKIVSVLCSQECGYSLNLAPLGATTEEINVTESAVNTE